MALVLKGGVSGVNMDVGSLFKAGKVESMPAEVGALGEYLVDFTSGSISAGMAAGSTIFGFRWTNASIMAMVKNIRAQIRATTGFTQGNVYLEAVTARAWSAADTGGTVVTPTGDTGKQKQSMAVSAVNEVRISSTAALTPGTRTLDAFPFATASMDSGAAIKPAVGPGFDLFEAFNEKWPQVYTVNEGFIIRGTVPATGVWILSLRVHWKEVANF